MSASSPNPVDHAAPFCDDTDQWDQHRYFFDMGLRFECTRCGCCCTGAPGVVMVDSEEQESIARHLGLPGDRFIARYCRKVERGWSIREESDGSCVFFAEGCRIYAVRPQQCRTYPFWGRNLRSEEDWEKTARECSGIGQGRRYDREHVLSIVNTPETQQNR